MENAHVIAGEDGLMVISCNEEYSLIGPGKINCENGLLNETFPSCTRGKQTRFRLWIVILLFLAKLLTRQLILGSLVPCIFNTGSHEHEFRHKNTIRFAANSFLFLVRVMGFSCLRRYVVLLILLI